MAQAQGNGRQRPRRDIKCCPASNEERGGVTGVAIVNSQIRSHSKMPR
ncbi:hypothetical protein [Mixta calida]|nr:hypothetical protein Y888_07585 [Mixta calida B021323]QNU42077.1 hypothetical protein IDH70_11960 [Mixta calida]